MINKLIFTITIILLGLVQIQAQDGSFDQTFNAGGTGLSNGVNAAGISKTILQPDGKILVAGTFNAYNGTTTRALIRLHADGSLDTAFNNNIMALPEIRQVVSMVLQPDGKIILGEYNQFNGTTFSIKNLLRLNANGTLDNSFNTNAVSNQNIHDIKLQSNGKIVFIINSGITGTNIKRIVRLHSNGLIDSTFNNNPLHDWINSPTRICVLPNDDLIFYGALFAFKYGSSAANYVYKSKLVKLTSNGNFDSTFNATNAFRNSVGQISTIANTSNNKLIIGGTSNTKYENQSKQGFMRLNADGSYDNTFNQDIGLNLGAIYAIEIQNDEKILIAGSFDDYNNVVSKDMARVDSNGVLDNSFSSGTGVFYNNNGPERINQIHLTNDSKIIISGNFVNYDGNTAFEIARLANAETVAVNNVEPLNYTITVFPNPVSNTLNISSEIAIEHIQIISTSGQIICSNRYDKTFSCSIPTQKFNKGLYYVKIVLQNKKPITTKIIKD